MAGDRDDDFWIKSPAEIIDQTLLRPDATLSQVKRFLADAKTYRFHAVCVLPWFVPEAVGTLKHCSRIKICTVVGFPLGGHSRFTKIFEAMEGARRQADELDVVINIGALKSGEIRYVREELSEIMKNTTECVHKIILEMGFLERREIEAAAAILNRLKPDFAKTSTGVNTRGVETGDITRLRVLLDPDIQIKAAGGIRDLETLKKMVTAGATRIGTSSGVKIMKEYLQNDL